jgi:SAM-dependent methyltransferase
MSELQQSLFLEIFELLPRQGPGSEAATLKALAMCDGLPPGPRVLDLGCGSGAQTLDLAVHTRGLVMAVDAHAPLVEKLQARIERARLADRVHAMVADMGSLDLPEGEFDLIWSEGALYNVGIPAGLALAERLLVPAGYLVFSEPVWRTAELNDEVRSAFEDYAAMGTVDEAIEEIARADWELVGHFELPASAWWDDFYTPLEQRIAEYRERYRDDMQALEALELVAREPAMHRESGWMYGYEFFVARRPATPKM